MFVRTRALILVAVTAVLCTGCLRAEVGVTVEGDGGTLTLDLFPGEELSEQLEAGGLGLESIAANASSNAPGSDVSVIEEDGQQAIRVEIPFDDYRQMTEALVDSRAVTGLPIDLVQTMTITEGSDGNWEMRATVDPTVVSSNLAAAFGVPAESLSSGEEPTFNLNVTLPGKVTSSNADQESGGTATWNLSEEGAPNDLTMKTEPAGLSTVTIALIAGGLAVGLGMIFVLVSRGGTGTKRAAKRRGKGVVVGVGPQGWAPPPSAPPVLSPGQWSSPPPYSSHKPGAPAPVDVVGVAGGAGAAGAGGVAPQLPPLPPMSAPVEPPPPGPDGTPAWGPSGQATVTDRVGPPVLPHGFVPTPTNAFPETHSPGPAPVDLPPPLPPGLDVPPRPPAVPPSDDPGPSQ